MEASLADLKLKDKDWLSAILKEFQDRTESLVRSIQEEDSKTLTKWQKRMQEKMDLAIERRLIRLEILIEARAGEKILEVRSAEQQVASGSDIPLLIGEQESIAEAKRRALDMTSYDIAMKEAIDDFQKASHDNIKHIIEASNEEARLLEVHLSVEDRQFADQVEVEDPKSIEELQRLIKARDLKRSTRMAKIQAKRQVSLKEILDLNSLENIKFLEGVKELSLDDLDEMCLGARSLEDFCFDY